MSPEIGSADSGPRRPVSVLVVAAAAAARMAKSEILSGLGADTEICLAADIDSGKAAIEAQHIDICLAAAPAAQAWRWVELVRSASPPPLIMLMSPGSPELGEEPLRQGAQDCLRLEPGCGSDLARAIRSAIARHEAARRSAHPGEGPDRGASSLHTIVAASADATVVIDRQGDIRFANPAALEMFGERGGDLVGQTFGYPLVESELTEIDFLRAGGGSGTAEMRVVEVSWNGEPAYLATLRDISARVEAEQAMAALKEQLRLFIAHAPAALAMFDREMRYLAVSRRWVTDYMLAEPTIIGRSHYDIFPQISERWKEVHRRALAGEIVRSDSDRFPRHDGSEQWLRWEVRPWYTSHGNVGGIVIFTEDISARKRAEEALALLNTELERRVAERTAELAAANRELESFAYAVSHDLRAPLRALNGFSQALIEDCGDRLPAEAQPYLREIGQASRYMGELIDGLLALSRSTRGGLARDAVDLSALAAQHLAALARSEPDRQVSVAIEPGLTAQCDARMIDVALRNLLDNAWKYTGRVAAAQIRVYAEQRDGRSWYCVADNGAGFDESYAQRLFKPFQRLHRQEEFPGLGVGLATVQRIIHRHGGSIEARGVPDQGACFCFTLPSPADQAAVSK